MKASLIVIALAVGLSGSTAAVAQYGYENEDCTNAKDQARSAASELSSYARRLQRCADFEDFTNDCNSEFRRVRNAQSNYEMAVSEVSSYCD